MSKTISAVVDDWVDTQLQEIAEKENRSKSNLIELILKDDLRSRN